MNIADIFPKVKKRAGDVGIEIEVEGIGEMPRPLTDALIEHWDAKSDGTLRGGFGVEFVSRQPFYLNNTFDRKVSNLVDHIRQTKIQENSPNTSVHVHHNMSHKTLMEVLNGITAWWLLENLLVHHCGTDREANMFCLRLVDAEALVPKLITALESSNFPGQFNDSYRYAAINLKALSEYGSLEVRTMRGAVVSGTIIEWAREVNLMFDKAARFRNPEEIFAYLIKASKEEFVQHFFTTTFANKLMNQYGWRDRLDQSAVLVCNFAYGLEWPIWEKKFEERMKKVKPEKKKGMLDAVLAGSWAVANEVDNTYIVDDDFP